MWRGLCCVERLSTASPLQVSRRAQLVRFSSSASSSCSSLRLSAEYVLSVGCLVAYSAVLAHLSFGYLAACFSVVLLVLDVVIALLVCSRLSHRPGVAGALVLLSRVCVCAFGEQWYLVGHTALFVALSLYIWSLILDNAAPARLTALVAPFSTVTHQHAPPSTLIARQQQQTAPPESGSLSAGTTDLSPSAPLAPSLPSDWPAPRPTPQSFTRLPLLAVALWVLCLLFAADVFASYELLTAHSALLASQSSSEWVGASASTLLTSSPLCVAVAGALLTVEMMALSLLWRLYRNAHFAITAGCWLLLAVCYCPLLAAAVALQLPSQAAPLWLSVSVAFVPVLSLHSVHLLCQWRLRDYRVAVEAAYTRRLQSSLTLSAAQRSSAIDAVRRFDARMVASCGVQAALVAGLSGCLAGLCSPWYAGLTVLLALLTLHFTVIPLLQWFHSFRWTRAMSVQCAAAAASLLSVCLFHFVDVQRAELSATSFLLLLLFFLYPAVLSVTLALCKWRDDRWHMTPFTVWCLLLGVLSLVLFCFLIAVLFPPWYVGAGLLLCVVSLLLLLLHSLPSLHSQQAAQHDSSALTASAVAFRVCVSLLSVVAPIVAGLYYADVWLAFTAGCGVLLLLCAWQLLSGAHSLHSAASPVSALTADWLSSLCSPRRQYVLVDGHSVLGVWLVPALSSTSDCSIAPPRSLRGAAVAAYCLLAVLFVWGHLALFFPPAAAQPPSSAEPNYTAASFEQSDQSSAAVAVGVAAALIAAACCAAAWLALHIAHLRQQQKAQFECERWAVQQLAQLGDAKARTDELSGRRTAGTVTATARAAWQEVEESGVDGESGGGQQSESVVLLARGWLRAAKARARKSVPKVESFSSERVPASDQRSAKQQQPSSAALLLASLNPARSSSLNKIRPASSAPAEAAAATDADELLSFVQSFHSLLHSSARPAFCSRAEYESACRLHDRYMLWASERELFGCCWSVQLHHLLLLALHEQLHDTAAMCKHFEALHDEYDDGRAAERRRDRVSAAYLALLRLHQQQAVHQLSSPSPARISPSSVSASSPCSEWSQYSRWLMQWRSYREALLQAASARREAQTALTVRRQRIVLAAAERQMEAGREAIAHRRAERRKALQTCQLNREAELDEQQSRQAAAQPHTAQARPQPAKRRRNHRTARRVQQMHSQTEQPSAAAAADCQPSEQPASSHEDEAGEEEVDGEAMGGDRYQSVTAAVRRGAAQRSNDSRRSSPSISGTGKRVSSSPTAQTTAPHSA